MTQTKLLIIILMVMIVGILAATIISVVSESKDSKKHSNKPVTTNTKQVEQPTPTKPTEQYPIYGFLDIKFDLNCDCIVVIPNGGPIVKTRIRNAQFRIDERVSYSYVQFGKIQNWENEMWVAITFQSRAEYDKYLATVREVRP